MRLSLSLGCLLAAACAVPACAQFDLEESHTTASLRGIDFLGAGVAWASGASGTILRTEDGGFLWQTCTVPKGAEKLDFRGIQGFDAQTAVIMASGKGPLSAIFKTTDGCQTWKKVFANPDAEGFFDALHKVTGRQMYLMGDQVGGKFAMFFSPDQGSTWFIADDPGLDAEKGDGGFAASNSGLTSVAGTVFFGTGGGVAAHVYATSARCAPGTPPGEVCPLAWSRSEVPVAAGAAGAGVFSLAGRTIAAGSGRLSALLVAVGGDYQMPDASARTAAWSSDGGRHWAAASTMPSGYRSAVAFDSAAQAWIAVGPNGVNVSFNNGKDWGPVKPAPGEAEGTGKGWNAISLPFVVGGKGRIGKIRPETLKK